MSMWPNPTRNGNVTLELNGLDSEAMVATMDMFDLFGKKVMSNTLTTDGAQELNTVFNTNDLAAGMYTVNVISGSRTFTSRLVIE
ncbi:MAG: T9SS type A sorting domain-containing protein [Flavobacteriales bacterium]|nr:T9SS type A sorting domain-containing protein [Flavobacteriales bacterium]